ncbi:hypothetical protein T439DRAFT_348764 [Meredithblackwellia eburnea MCA 4105]
MFFNQDVLTKRGPLARVWMASHLSTKLTKATLLSTSIPSSVSSILGQDLLPMALRLSGQLLLGVARIYSRKTKYLLDDCNETLSKVKKAFGKPGAVDLDDSDARGRDAITVRVEGGGLDDILGYNDHNWAMDFNAPIAGPSGLNNKGKNKANTGAAADIDLPPQAHEFDLFANDDDEEPMYDLGPDGALVFDLGLEDELDDMMPETGRGRKRSASALEDEDDMDVELGRRDAAPNASDRGGSVVSQDAFGDDDDVFGGKDGEQIDLGLGDDDLGGFEQFDFGGGGDEFMGDLAVDGDREKTPQANDENAPPAIDLTPRTAADLAARGDAKQVGNKKQKLRKQVVDRVTELDWEAGNKAAVEARKELLFAEPKFLPRSRTHLRLLERASDPSFYLPKPLDATGNMYLFAPPGVAPQHEHLFKFSSRRALIKAQGRERSPDNEVEQGRDRVGSPDGFDFNQDFGGGGADDSFGMEGGAGFGDDLGGHDDFQFDLDEGEVGREEVEQERAAKRQKMIREHEAAIDAAGDEVRDVEEEEEEGQGGFTDSVGALAVFDQQQASATQTQTQTQVTGDDDEDGDRAKGAWSKNTMKAVGVLRSEVKKEGQSVKFEKVAGKASRRAAASFFFELLVLSTRDCIEVKQPAPYKAITIEAKEKLFTSAQVVEVEEQDSLV